MLERVRVLVESVSRHALRRAAQAISIRANRDLVMTNSSRDHAFAQRFTDQGAALGHFAGMPRQPGGESTHEPESLQIEQNRCSVQPNKIRPVAIACWSGSTPIMPTMRLLRSMTLSLMGSAGLSGTMRLLL